MLNTTEVLRRQNEDVCSACGWMMMQGAYRFKCVNPHCSQMDLDLDDEDEFDVDEDTD